LFFVFSDAAASDANLDRQQCPPMRRMADAPQRRGSGACHRPQRGSPGASGGF